MTQSGSNKPPVKLPKLRKGITVAFSDYDREGKPQWLIHDAGRNKFFIIGWVEYEIIERWYLGNAEKIVEAVNNETTLQIDLKDIENVLQFLAYNYLIQQSGYQIYKRAKEQKLFKKDNFLHWLVTYYLFFRIPLVHPDAFLEKTKRFGEFLFSKTLFYIMLVVTLIAFYQLGTRWDLFVHSFSSIFTWQGLFFYFIAYTVTKFLHELGHAYMCKRYGVPVPAMGIAFLVFWPVLYTDTTLSWSLDHRKRLRIALAGIWMETYVTIIAALIWCNVDNLTIKSITYLVISVNWIASLLINVSPFMRFDGYYVLADYLKMPNLQPRAFALTRWQIRRWLFHWPDPPPEKFTPGMHRFLIIYSIATWLYRLVLYLGIAILVYHFFIKIVGILLFAIEIYYFILAPIVNEFTYWYAAREKFALNIRTRITLFLVVLSLFIFFIPIQETVKFPGTLSYKHAFLIAPEGSMLETPIPPLGSVIKANTPIVQLKSSNLTYNLKKTLLEYQKKMNELRRASINPRYIQHKNILLSDISKVQAQYTKLINQSSLYELSVPFNGILVDRAGDIFPGTTVKKDELLGDVIATNEVQGEAFVSQVDVNKLKVGLTGYFYPESLSEPKVPVKITAIEVVNASKLSCSYSSQLIQQKNETITVETPCYNASDLGGNIPTLITEQGEYVPVDSVFRVLLTPSAPVNLKHVTRGTMVIDTQGMSFADRFFYQFKTLWIKQTGF